MIEQELILLGFLRGGPKHGYEIKKKIRDILFLFAGVDLKSIYYPLEVLEKKDLVKKHISKQGRRPQRLVYALTKKGEARFKELLEKSFLDFKRPRFTLDLSLFFLNYIDPNIAKRKLRTRTLILDRLVRNMQQMVTSLKKEKSSSLSRILEHNLQMVDTESRFLAHLIKAL